jgi:hypothetical protein
VILPLSAVAMPALYRIGAHVAALYMLVFVVDFCYGTQAWVNPSTISDFWGTRNAGVNCGLLLPRGELPGSSGRQLAEFALTGIRTTNPPFALRDSWLRSHSCVKSLRDVLGFRERREAEAPKPAAAFFPESRLALGGSRTQLACMGRRCDLPLV